MLDQLMDKRIDVYSTEVDLRQVLSRLAFTRVLPVDRADDGEVDGFVKRCVEKRFQVVEDVRTEGGENEVDELALVALGGVEVLEVDLLGRREGGRC